MPPKPSTTTTKRKPPVTPGPRPSSQFEFSSLKDLDHHKTEEGRTTTQNTTQGKWLAAQTLLDPLPKPLHNYLFIITSSFIVQGVSKLIEEGMHAYSGKIWHACRLASFATLRSLTQ